MYRNACVLAAALVIAAPITVTVTRAAETTGEYVSDAALTSKVKVKLLGQKELSSTHISVESTDGVVTLSGTVPSKAQIELAENAAKEVKGVKDVHNELRSDASK